LPDEGFQSQGPNIVAGCTTAGDFTLHHLLGFALAEHIRHRRDPRQGCFFIRRPIESSQSQGIHGRNVYQPGPCLASCGSDQPRPFDVDRAMHIELRPADVNMTGRMDDHIDSLSGLADGACVANVPLNPLDIQPR